MDVAEGEEQEDGIQPEKAKVLGVVADLQK